jgi:hypothetical protein
LSKFEGEGQFYLAGIDREGLTGPLSTCMVRYDRATGTLSLRDDLVGWQTPQHLPAAGSRTASVRPTSGRAR